MGDSAAVKILKKHLVEGEPVKGQECAIRIDQTLTQDATGTMAYLQFEALGVPRVKTELSVSYVDHNTAQEDFKNPDDHRYLQSIAAKYGIKFSRPGNGICHQVHLERFARPGRTLLGSDSHTPTAGGVGSIAIGAGGLDVAFAMAGLPFHLKFPAIINIHLTGKLSPFVSAKDVILAVLQKLGVNGGLNKVIEYTGPGVKTLSVPDRATITNMGAETGATTSVFPSDEITLAFLKAQDREKDWEEILPDADAEYDEVVEINLSELEPMAATPHSPGNISAIKDIEGLEVQQVCIGSCTNSSLRDLRTVAALLKGRTVHPGCSLVISPGSRQVFRELADSGDLGVLIGAGARILECTCGPCIGQGQAPPSAGVSVRTFNRNFEGRSGTKDGKLYLVSPETAAATAVFGKLTDPRKLGEMPEIKLPESFLVDDSMILEPSDNPDGIEILRGPNIAPLPMKDPLEEVITGEVLLKTGDNITTDHIMPAGKYLPLRSNVPEYAKHVFEGVDKDFADRAKAKGGGFIIGGNAYGQGSSREHAALCPMYLGVKAVIVKSFARIHLKNLINFGIVPFEFVNAEDYDRIEQGDKLEVRVIPFEKEMVLKNVSKNLEFTIRPMIVSQRDIEILKAGGELAFTKSGS
ncbi:MAG: aconitate hydratase [Firmicutes bacterium]|nr:aconitate hydratase [Bacillota bacterium]